MAAQYTNVARTQSDAGLLLGVRPDENYLETEFTMLGGDRLLLYTDGLLDAENAAGLLFGDVVLTHFIEAMQDLRAEPFVEQLLKEVLAWSWESGRPGQSDDITVVVIDVKERENARA